ncbi:gallidermin/nisin family lantibiotic [Geomicrobium sp. JCM 19055]|uniref:gallidermin/nisin family lantibiotic n=1 Tax=Geomicrobium sp. JCM 19055 TaxID=1460649 RepID=UPI0005AA9963|nr:gallidermin/nisin family lantibiotic [Geomicrobium sp. JCM 19055]
MANPFDLDVEVVKTEANDVEPDFTSVSFCTPGCGTQVALTASVVNHKDRLNFNLIKTTLKDPQAILFFILT